MAATLGLVFPALAGSLVRIDTPVGSVTLELYDQERPITVQNFLSYIKKGRYVNSFSHRLLPNFVIQGGGFFLNGNNVDAVTTDAPIKNEYNGAAKFSNVKGTITMAKVDGNPDSATSQWFINLKDNNTGLPEAGNLDLQNGGFTVFGRVVAGAPTLEIFNADFADADTTVRSVYDKSADLGNPFAQLPMLASALQIQNLIFTTVTLLSEELPTLQAPAKIKAKKASAKIRGTASAGVSTIEWRVGTKGKFHQSVGGAAWQLNVTGLKPGKNILSVRPVTSSGGAGGFKKIKVIRK